MTALVDPVRVALIAYARGAGACQGCAVEFVRELAADLQAQVPTGSLPLVEETTLERTLQRAERAARTCVGAGHQAGPS